MFSLIKLRASSSEEKALFFMHEAQAEWYVRAAPSPDPEPFEDAFDLPGEVPAAANATPPPPTPSPPTATPAIAPDPPDPGLTGVAGAESGARRLFGRNPPHRRR